MLDRLEFERSLVDVLEYWGARTRREVYDLMGREVAGMVGFDQRNPHHCHDLFTHTLMTVDGVRNRDDVYLSVAAFFHDVGKPKVAMEKNGRLVFYRHSSVSSEIAEKILCRTGYDEEEIKLINFYVRHHDDFISYVLPSKACNARNSHMVVIDEHSIRRYVVRMVEKNGNMLAKHGVKKILTNLFNLCAADIRAQAEKVYLNDQLVDSMEHKLNKINAISELTEYVIEEERL